MSNVVEFPPSDRPAAPPDADKLHAEAFRYLENAICDCVSMARIAAQEVNEIRTENRELVFAVRHVSEMLAALKASYYTAWRGQNIDDDDDPD
jgi:hypothetical protein